MRARTRVWPAVLAAMALFAGAQPPPGESAARFRYDAASGDCVDAQGHRGLNPPAPAPASNECADYRGRVVLYLNAEGGDFRGADFDRARFRYLNLLAGANPTGARLTNVDAATVDLAGANLRAADLTGAVFAPCVPSGAGACLDGAIYDERTRLPFPEAEAIARGMRRV